MSELNISDINYLNIFPHMGKIARLEVLEVQQTGGRLKAGAYTIALRYFDELGTPTSFFTTTQQIAIGPQSSSSETVRGDAGEAPTARSIRLAIRNLDQHYAHFQLAVIPQYNGSVGIPLLLPAQAIISSTMYYVITGAEKATETTLDEIIINTASYARARTITQVDGHLYMGNMRRFDAIDYQKYANNIKVKTKVAEVDEIQLGQGQMRVSSVTNHYGDPFSLSYHSRGFKRGEVYAFYISFILKDGHETPAFHIPGRKPTNFAYKGEFVSESAPVPETEGVLRSISGVDGEDVSMGRWFHFVSKPHVELGTGYWENRDEIYPFSKDWDVWDVSSETGEGSPTGESLSGQRVRHHQMPDVEYEPYLTPATGLIFPGEPKYKIKVLGVQFDDIKIPNEIREHVAAVRIHYAKRRGINERIADQSFGLPVTIEQDDMSSGTVGHPVPSQWAQSPPHYSIITTILSRNNVILHPFNLLRTKDNIQDINYLKVIGRCPTLGQLGREQPEFGSNFRTVYDNLFDPEYFEWGPPSNDKRFFQIKARSYIPSYGFAEAGANSLVRLSDDQFVRDYDNTNGEEKIIVNITPPQARSEFGAGDPFPNFLFEICRYRENMFLDFDLQELVFTGYQTLDVANFDPTSQEPEAEYGKYSTGPVFGGDTFVGVWVSRHSWWLDEDNPVWQSLRYTAVETKAYPDYRSPGTQPWEQWIPGTTSQRENYAAIIWKDGKPNLENKEGDVFPDNPIKYNIDYLMGETYKQALPLLKRRSDTINLPTRIIRSRQERLTADIDYFRQFLEDDYADLPTNRGALIKLSNLNNLLIPHMRHSIFRTRGREELATGDFRAFLGSGDIFATPPEELYETDIGHGGLRTIYSSVVTEYGYLFIDYEARKVFHLTPEGLMEASAHGLEGFFKNRLPFNFEAVGFDLDNADSSHFGLEVTWDPTNKRYLITKRDIKFLQDVDPETFTYNSLLQEFRNSENEVVAWEDESVFESDSFTVSFSPELQVWVSFHDYFPDMYFYNSKHLYSGLNANLFRHNDSSSRCVYYGTTYPSILEFVDNREQAVSKTVSGLFIQTEVEDQQGVSIRDKTVSSIRLWNSWQDTGDIDVTHFIAEGNARRAQGFWRINQLRNLKESDGTLNLNKDWHEKQFLSDLYHYVKLEYDNAENHVIYFISSELNIKPSLR